MKIVGRERVYIQGTTTMTRQDDFKTALVLGEGLNITNQIDTLYDGQL